MRASAGETRETAADDDAALIERSLVQPEAFAGLYDRYCADVHRYIARRLGTDIADDLMAETFVVAFERRARFDPARAGVRPWLFGVATNLMAGHRRTEARRMRAVARAGGRTGDGDGHADEVAARLSAAGARPRLMSALAGLSPRNRDVLLLVAWGGLDHDEVAQALGLSAGAVRTRLHRARQAVRAALGGVDPSAEQENQS